MAYGAILREGLAFLRYVIAIVTTEASGIVHMPNVIGVSSPSDLHLRKTVGRENGDEAFSRSFDEVRMGSEHIRMFAAIELCKRGWDFFASFSFGRVVGLEEFQALLMNPRKFGADGAFCHGTIERVLRGLHGVGGAIVTIDAVHYATL